MYAVRGFGSCFRLVTKFAGSKTQDRTLVSSLFVRQTQDSKMSQVTSPLRSQRNLPNFEIGDLVRCYIEPHHPNTVMSWRRYTYPRLKPSTVTGVITAKQQTARGSLFRIVLSNGYETVWSPTKYNIPDERVTLICSSNTGQ